MAKNSEDNLADLQSIIELLDSLQANAESSIVRNFVKDVMVQAAAVERSLQLDIEEDAADGGADESTEKRARRLLAKRSATLAAPGAHRHYK